MEINIQKTPLSRYGSYISIRGFKDDKYVYICPLFAHCEKKKFRIMPIYNGKEIPFELFSFHSHVILKTELGNLRIYIKDNFGLVIKSSNVDYKLEFVDEFINGFAFDKNGIYTLISEYSSRLFYHFLCVEGNGKAEYTWYADKEGDYRHKCKNLKYNVICNNGIGIVYINISRSDGSITAPNINELDDIQKIEKEFDVFKRSYKCSVNAQFKDTVDLALYVMWSSVLSPFGFFKRDAMLMSNNWMRAVWSWDQCFNALALAGKHNELSFAQLIMPFDYQEDNGKLPDLVCDDAAFAYCTKPPVHGLFAKKLINIGAIPDNELSGLYKKLVLVTNWWFEERDDNKNGICQYNHGNESGWDNSTLFDDNATKETPDLTAYLLMQIDAIIYISEKLGRLDDTKCWKQRFSDLMFKYNKYFSASPDFAQEEGSLLSLMPVVLGEFMAKNQFNKIVSLLSEENNYLTAYGLATESIKSVNYIKGASYWRGAMWAPAVYIIVDGLRRGGEDKLARKIALRFCKTISGKDGIYENYDSLTGEGYDDPAYTWTASVFVQLIEEYDL